MATFNSTKRALYSLALPTFCLLAACSGSDAHIGDSGTIPSDDGSEGATESEAPTWEVTRSELASDQLVPKSFRWGAIQFKLVGGEVETTKTDIPLWGDDSLEYYVARNLVLHFEAENLLKSQEGFSVDYWDLVFPSTSRSSAQSQSFAMGPNERGKFEVTIPMEDEVDLRGAVLEIQEQNYGVYEPLYVPLDAPLPASSNELTLTSLEGSVYEPQAEAGFTRKISIDVAQVTMDSGSTHAAEGKKLVYFQGRHRCLDAPSNDVMLRTDLYLTVNGDPVYYHRLDSDTVYVGQETQIVYVFEIPIETIAMDLNIVVGQVPTEKRTIHVDLSVGTPRN
jgi:hypothetical protein